MVTIEKGNVVLQVPEDKLPGYLQDGYKTVLTAPEPETATPPEDDGGKDKK
ncbi:MAG: hypothetical protein ABF449_02775 [Ethanoligenens sp.]